jgi:hypothetical protein
MFDHPYNPDTSRHEWGSEDDANNRGLTLDLTPRFTVSERDNKHHHLLSRRKRRNQC